MTTHTLKQTEIRISTKVSTALYINNLHKYTLIRGKYTPNHCGGPTSRSKVLTEVVYTHMLGTYKLTAI